MEVVSQEDGGQSVGGAQAGGGAAGRRIEFSLAAATQPQQRSKRARKSSGSLARVNNVIPGEAITSQGGFLRGHGTYVEDGELIATVSGVVERVNKLVSVKALKSRYTGEVGDVVVGRIVDVAQKRWKVDVNARQDAILMLSSINLPGGVQRRRTDSDALQMRTFFAENDLISAEVQQFFSDGAMSIHTRSLKYGKLQNGEFLAVQASLVKRCKTTFHSLPCGVDVILGNNGYIWISQPEAPSTESERVIREKICRVRNAIVALSKQFLSIHPTTVMDVYEASLRMHPKDMLLPGNIEKITARAQNRPT
ncbi:Exosome complex component rrp4 [Balamuthia mandrillaris]